MTNEDDPVSNDLQSKRSGETHRTPAGVTSWLVVTASLLHGLACWWLIYIVPGLRHSWSFRYSELDVTNPLEMLWDESGYVGRSVIVLLVASSVAYIGSKLNWRVAHILVVQGLVYIVLATWLSCSAWLRTGSPP